MAVNAARGQHRAQRLFAELLGTTEAANYKLYNEYLCTALDYKKYWENEIARCRMLALEIPTPVPHPDDITIDMNTGKVIIKGPMTPEDKVSWDRLWAQVDECDLEIAALTRQRRRARSEELRQQMDSEIEYSRELRAMIVNTIGERPKR